MSNWIRLHDVYVDTEKQNPARSPEFWQPLIIARCISRLYDNERFLPDCEQGEDYGGTEICECHGRRY